MTVFIIETYAVKSEKQAEFKSLVRRSFKLMKDNPNLFKGVKSVKLFTQTFGSISGAYVELIECDSLGDYEKCMAELMKNEEFAKLNQEMMPLIEATTLSMSAWEPVTY